MSAGPPLSAADTAAVVDADVTPPLSITLPRSVDGWATLLVLLGGLGWSIYEGYYPVVTVLLPMAYQQLKVSGRVASAFTAAVTGIVLSRHAMQTTETVKGALRDIQGNPALPGTPGWMDARESRGPI